MPPIAPMKYLQLILLVLIMATPGSAQENEPGPSRGRSQRVGSVHKTGDRTFHLTHDQRKRKYILHLPSSISAGHPVPLVIALHGGGGNASESVKYFQFNSLADTEGFIVAYPEGTGVRMGGKKILSWNAGRCCGPAMDENVDDVGFLAEMIRRISKDFNIDARRIYMLGFSNGSQMAYRFACERSEMVSAVALGGTVGTFDGCRFTRPVPVFYFEGTLDPCSPPQGAEECGGCLPDFFNRIGIPAKRFTYRCDSNQAFLEKLKTLNTCTDSYETTHPAKDVECRTYGQCSNGSEIISCIIDGGGHTWPGRTTYEIMACQRRPNGRICQEWKKAVGPLIPDFNVNTPIWNFFKAHSATH